MIRESLYITLTYLAIFFYLPLITLIYFSYASTYASISILFKPVIYRVLLSSFLIALLTSILTLIITYPIAYYIAIHAKRKELLFTIIVVPMFISYLVKVYSIYNVLIIIEDLIHVKLVNTFLGALIGMVYEYYPYMFLPIYSVLSRVRVSTILVAYSLGASPLQTFLRVVLPLTLPGIITGFTLVFLLSMTEFVIPAVLGGVEVYTIGYLIWDMYFVFRNIYAGSLLSLIVSTLSIIVVMLISRKIGRLL